MNHLSSLLLILSLLFFISCKDSCDDEKCLHDGFCESGECQCGERYTGETCEIEIVPSSVKIISFVIKTHEIKPNGEPWDIEPGIGANPDIYVKVFDENNNLFQDGGAFFIEDINELTLLFQFEIIDVTKQFRLEVYDEDGAIDELIYELPFRPYEEGLNFPTQISKFYSAENIPPVENGELTINLQYCF